MHRCIISQSNLLFFLIYFSPKYSSIQNGKVFYLLKMSQPIKKIVKTSPEYFSFPQRGWSGSKGITGLFKAIKKIWLKKLCCMTLSNVPSCFEKTKICVLGKFSWFSVSLLKSFNLGNVNMGFISCIYLYKPISISICIHTHTCCCFRN